METMEYRVVHNRSSGSYRVEKRMFGETEFSTVLRFNYDSTTRVGFDTEKEAVEFAKSLMEGRLVPLPTETVVWSSDQENV